MKKITLVDANNWFRRYMYSDNFLDIPSMIVDLASLNPTYLVWDGYNGNAKRREIYPDYKKSRKEKDMDTDFETLNMIRNDLIPYLPCCSVSADGFEGDDVINHLCEKLSVWEDTEFEIISTDKDLAAILPNSSRVSNPLVSEKFMEIVGRREWIPLYKTLVGDPSDCICGFLVGDGVPSRVRGYGVVRVRNEGDLIRHYLKHQIHETWNRIPFYVEFCSHRRSDRPYIRVPDVPFIRPRMDSDTFRSDSLAVDRRLLHIRHVPAAGVAEGRDLVDVYT